MPMLFRSRALATLAVVAGVLFQAAPGYADEAVPASPAGTAQATPLVTSPAPNMAAAPFRLAQAQLGAELLGKLAGDGRRPLVMVSPISLATALSMTARGADVAAAQAIADTLRLPPGSGGARFEPVVAAAGATRTPWPDNSLSFASSLWANDGFVIASGFVEEMEKTFGAPARTMPFTEPATTGAINAWVIEATGGAIRSIVTTLPADGQLVIASAFHFKGKWALPFDRTRTSEDTFTAADGVTSKVPMMTLGGPHPIAYREDGRFQAVDLAYGDGDLRLSVILPRDGTATANAMLNELAAESGWLVGDGYQARPGALRLPRFTGRSGGELLDALTALGLGPALRPGAFAGIGTPAPSLSSVLQQTALTIDEEGAEASAATAVLLGRSAGNEAPFSMTCDHPFVVALRQHSTGAVLLAGFIGKIESVGRETP